MNFRRISRRFLRILPLPAIVVAIGCQREVITPQGPVPVQTVTRVGSQPNSAANQNNGQYFDVDDCANRLHDIEGQLIGYYATYRHLPATLEELRPFVDVGEQADYTCPVSHLSYVYVPQGLVFGSDTRRLIVYDATPVHNGSRWGILFSPAHGRQPVTTQVISIPESSMRGYAPAPPMTRPAG